MTPLVSSGCAHTALPMRFAARATPAQSPLPLMVYRQRTPADAADAAKLVTQAIARRDAGDTDAALGLLTQAMHVDPSSAGAHVQWALTLETTSSFTNDANNAAHAGSIAASYRTALRLEPSDAAAHTFYGNWLVRRGAATAACDAYADAIAIDGRNVEAHTRLADVLMALDDALGAMQHYQAALETDPHAVPALWGLGDAAEAAHESQIALRAHQTLINDNPGAVLFQSRLIAFYRRSGQHARAAALTRALNNDAPKDPRRLRALRH